MNDLVITSRNEIMSLADALEGCALLPTAYKRKAERVYALMKGAELGLPPIYSLDNIQVIEGKTSLSADCKLAICKRSPEYAGSELAYSADMQSCTFTMNRKYANGTIDKSVTTFSMADAEKAKLVRTNSGWEKHPKRMLRARVVGFGCNDLFGDLFAGLYTPEEVEEFTSPPIKTEVEIVEPKPDKTELVTLLKQANDLLSGVALIGSQAEDYRQQIKDFFRDSNTESLRATVQALQSIKDYQEKQKADAHKSEPVPEPVIEETLIPEPDAIPESTRDLWSRISKEYNAIPSYRNEKHQTNSSNQHLGVEKHTQCTDESKLKKYIAYLVGVRTGKTKEVELPTLDEAAKSVNEYLNSHSNDYADTIDKHTQQVMGLYNANDIEGLVAMLAKLKRESSVPFEG
jgi:hypothetical protein